MYKYLYTATYIQENQNNSGQKTEVAYKNGLECSNLCVGLLNTCNLDSNLAARLLG